LAQPVILQPYSLMSRPS